MQTLVDILLGTHVMKFDEVPGSWHPTADTEDGNRQLHEVLVKLFEMGITNGCFQTTCPLSVRCPEMFKQPCGNPKHPRRHNKITAYFKQGAEELHCTGANDNIAACMGACHFLGLFNQYSEEELSVFKLIFPVAVERMTHAN